MSSTGDDGVERVVVVGAPRSGTSLAAQLLAGAGFALGSDLIPPTEANPLGFLEQASVSDLDDELLAAHAVGRGAGQVPRRRLAWLAAVPPGVEVTASQEQRSRMAMVLPAPPAVVKDPRFTVTLDAWRPVLGPATSFVAVVRHPGEVAVSLRTMWERDRPYYGAFEVTIAHGLALWAAANRRLLDLLDHGRWFVADHAALLDGSGVRALGCFVGRRLDPAQPCAVLHRSRPEVEVSTDLVALHRTLVARAAADRDRWSGG